MSDDILALVHLEARLLDSWRLDEWLALFHPTGTYWLPIDEDSDPRVASSIAHEDFQGLAIRVEQLMRQRRISQEPRTETIHFISNIDVTQAGAAAAVVHYNLLITELRSGDWRQRGLGQTRLYPGRCRLTLLREAGAWLITEKQLVLLGRRQPVEGLSYLL